MSNFSVDADNDGNYLLGPNKDFVLTSVGLNHILNGDVSDRPVRVNGKFSHVEKVLMGGLHTEKGWAALKKTRPDLVHGAVFRSDRNKAWYFARELQNGVILLRMPLEMYQSKAAKLTKQADIYYKSGYLWKTLFPSVLSDSEIIEVINEALHNLDKEESSHSLLIGYAFLNDAFKAMKVRIQITGSIVNSAFPTWGQPVTGNNGKPYTQSDSIGFFLANSTKFFGDFSDYLSQKKKSTLLVDGNIIESLMHSTPSLFLQRPRFSFYYDKNAKEIWRRKVMDHGRRMSASDADQILKYLMDELILKGPYEFLSQSYGESFSEVSKSVHFENVFALYQNALDGFFALGSYDEIANTNLAITYAICYLRSRFLNTGGVDLWEGKRFHNTILEWVISKKNPELAWTYLKELALSPSRVACYSDFDLNPFAGHDIDVIGTSDPEVQISPQHLYIFVGNNLGLNYLMILGGVDRAKLAKEMQKKYCLNADTLAKNLVSMADSSEFVSFSYQFAKLLDILLQRPDLADKCSLDIILNDYYRIQVISNYRIVKDNYDILQKGRGWDFDPTPLSAYWYYTKVKHEQQFLCYSVSNFTEQVAIIAKALLMDDLSDQALKLGDNFRKEKIPLPRPIPSYIDSWRNKNKIKPSVMPSVQDLLDGIFCDERDI